MQNCLGQEVYFPQPRVRVLCGQLEARQSGCLVKGCAEIALPRGLRGTQASLTLVKWALIAQRLCAVLHQRDAGMSFCCWDMVLGDTT